MPVPGQKLGRRFSLSGLIDQQAARQFAERRASLVVRREAARHKRLKVIGQCEDSGVEGPVMELA